MRFIMKENLYDHFKDHLLGARARKAAAHAHEREAEDEDVHDDQHVEDGADLQKRLEDVALLVLFPQQQEHGDDGGEVDEELDDELERVVVRLQLAAEEKEHEEIFHALDEDVGERGGEPLGGVAHETPVFEDHDSGNHFLKLGEDVGA